MEKFDAAQVLLWSLTYVLICIYMFRYRKRRAVGIPYIACCFNFGWELNALFGQGDDGNIFYGPVWMRLFFV